MFINIINISFGFLHREDETRREREKGIEHTHKYTFCCGCFHAEANNELRRGQQQRGEGGEKTEKEEEKKKKKKKER